VQRFIIIDIGHWLVFHYIMAGVHNYLCSLFVPKRFKFCCPFLHLRMLKHTYMIHSKGGSTHQMYCIHNTCSFSGPTPIFADVTLLVGDTFPCNAKYIIPLQHSLAGKVHYTIMITEASYTINCASESHDTWWSVVTVFAFLLATISHFTSYRQYMTSGMCALIGKVQAVEYT